MIYHNAAPTIKVTTLGRSSANPTNFKHGQRTAQNNTVNMEFAASLSYRYIEIIGNYNELIL